MNEFEHYGVKGMRWGVRKARAQGKHSSGLMVTKVGKNKLAMIPVDRPGTYKRSARRAARHEMYAKQISHDPRWQKANAKRKTKDHAFERWMDQLDKDMKVEGLYLPANSRKMMEFERTYRLQRRKSIASLAAGYAVGIGAVAVTGAMSDQR